MKDESANIYAYSRNLVRDRFAPYLSGDASGLFAVVCISDLSDAARNALVKSAEALGYGESGVTFITVDAAGPALTADALLHVIEGLDPLCIVCANSVSAQLAAAAYRRELPTTGAARVMGREVRTFENLGALMDTPAHKQQAWALLKTLPRR